MSAPASSRDLKHRVLTCLHKLSDRDTFPSAAADLENIAVSLPDHHIPSFLSSISATDSADRTPVRRHCLRLVSLLCSTHSTASLSPHLPKLLSAVVRRIRDGDASVRTACAEAAGAIAGHVTRPPFGSVAKPLVEAMFTEQEIGAQIGAAMCVASAVDGAPQPDVIFLRKLIPRMEKLLKCDSFKAKPALLGVFGSVIEAGSASSQQVLKNLVPCLVEFVGSEDWAARKAAAEALAKLAVVDRNMLPEYKAGCLKNFEAKKFDKVKIVRETMTQLLEAWKEIPDVSYEVSPPREPVSSSKEDASDGRYPPGSRNSYMETSVNKKTVAASTTTPVRRRSPLDSNEKRSGQAMFRKLDRKKPTDRKIETATSHVESMTVAREDSPRSRDEERTEKIMPSRFSKQEIRRVLFKENEGSESTVVVSNVTEDIHRSQKESEDLSLIYKQLGHIENQQSNLLDLLQKFMGSSQTGLQNLETRVHGLELTLDEISYDLAVSTKKMSNSDSEGTSCCKLPGADFLSPKFWRKTEPRNSVSASRERDDKNASDDALRLKTRRFRMQERNGFIINPLADTNSDSHEISEIS